MRQPQVLVGLIIGGIIGYLLRKQLIMVIVAIAMMFPGRTAGEMVANYEIVAMILCGLTGAFIGWVVATRGR